MNAKWIDNHMNHLISDLCKLLSIKSVRNDHDGCKPFGRGIDNAVNQVVDIAKALELEVRNYDGYAIEIRVGKGESIAGVLGHVDVVDGGDGWTDDPFTPVIKDGKIFGRGTVDDKGPIVCAMYAAKYLAENNLIPEGKQLRIIIGADEECSWECMKYYKTKVKELPVMSIVADGNFPVIACEKGVLDFNLIFKCEKCEDPVDYHVLSLEGGTAKNIIPSRAISTIKVKDQEKIEFLIARANAKGMKYNVEAEKIVIESKGVPTHAMNPEKGFNAISSLIELIGELDEAGSCNISNFAKTYNRLIGMDYNGRKIGIACSDRITGALTFNVGTVSYSGGEITVGIDVRIPASIPYEQVVPIIKLKLKELNVKYEEEDFLPAINIDMDSDIVNILMEVYREVTGDTKSEPIAIGGATYARCLDNAIAFGPLFPNQEDRTHEANEFISIADLKLITELYIRGMEGVLSAI